MLTKSEADTHNAIKLQELTTWLALKSASHDSWCTVALLNDNYSTVGGDGGSRVGEVQAGTTSPMPDYKSFKLQYCQRCTHSIS